MNCHPDRSAERAVEGPAVHSTSTQLNRKPPLFIKSVADGSEVLSAFATRVHGEMNRHPWSRRPQDVIEITPIGFNQAGW
jgi:hypothetical protein